MPGSEITHPQGQEAGKEATDSWPGESRGNCWGRVLRLTCPPCQHQPHSEGSLPKPAGNCLAYWPGTSHVGPQGLRSSPALALPTAVRWPEPSPVALVAGAVWIATVW